MSNQKGETAPRMRVLSVEDEVDTVAALVGALRDAGADVQPVMELGAARTLVREKKYDLLLVDARMPDEGQFVHDGGLAFIHRLKRREYGALNVDCKFAIVTAYMHEVDQAELEKLDGFVTVLSKVTQGLGALEQELGHKIREDRTVREGYHLSEEIVVINGMPNENDEIEVVVPEWKNGESVWVRYSSLPQAVRQELEFGDRPALLRATVNTAAVRAEDVRPGNFRLNERDERSE